MTPRYVDDRPLSERIYESYRYDVSDAQTKRDIAFALIEAAQRFLRESDPQEEVRKAYEDGKEAGRMEVARIAREQFGQVFGEPQ